MGSRFSSSTTPADTAAASSASSAKVITVSGVLKEYAAAPLPASVVLADCCPPDQSPQEDAAAAFFFLCNADALSFDEPVPALATEDPVLPGRLYFVLPDGMQRRRLSGADMGALAVRASKALEAAVARGGSRGGKKKGRALKVSPVVDVILAEEGSLQEGCGFDRQRRTAAASSATRLAPAQLKKSAAVAGQRRGTGGRGSNRYALRGGSFRGRLGTIEEDAE